MFKMRKTLTAITLGIFAIFLLAPMVATAANPVDTTTTAVATAAVTQDAPAVPTGSKMYLGLAIAIGLGIAAAGGAVGQGRCAAAALDGIARNPGAAGKIFTPMILGLALIESLVLYSLVMGFVLLGKL
jgi:F-type H+-transporting ATPase subunit c